jgi:hypothetical protein
MARCTRYNIMWYKVCQWLVAGRWVSPGTPVSIFNRINLKTTGWFMMFNTTFNIISVISWRSVSLVEETGVPGETHRPATSHWQTLYHIMLYRMNVVLDEGYYLMNAVADQYCIWWMLYLMKVITWWMLYPFIRFNIHQVITFIRYSIHQVQHSSGNNLHQVQYSTLMNVVSDECCTW